MEASLAKQRICSILDCGKQVYCEGRCKDHYYDGPPTDCPSGLVRPRRRECSVAECGRVSSSNGYCGLHLKRYKRHGDPLGGTTQNGKPMQFLMAALAMETDECILWPFGKMFGYGSVWVGDRNLRSHRYICILAHGEPSDPSMQACHSCGDRACQNKRHLRWGTALENSDDMKLHGRRRSGSRVHCAKLTDDQAREILASSEQKNILATKYGVSEDTIYKIRSRRAWRHLG